MLAPFVHASNILGLAVSPVEALFAKGVRLLRGPPREEGQSERVRALEDKAEGWRTMYFTELDDNERLRTRIEQLEASLALNPGVHVGVVTAPVITVVSNGAVRYIKIKAGTAEGLSGDSVATYAGVHLIGRVDESLFPRLAHVLPIIDRASRPFRAVIIPGETAAELAPDPLGSAMTCMLKPVGDGTLEGDVTLPKIDPTSGSGGGGGGGAGAKPLLPAVGMTVRLSDPNWPASAQMLVVGRVSGVQTKENLRRTVIVQPDYPAIDRLSEVIVRSPAADPAVPAAPKENGP